MTYVRSKLLGGILLLMAASCARSYEGYTMYVARNADERTYFATFRNSQSTATDRANCEITAAHLSQSEAKLTTPKARFWCESGAYKG
jgi:hypothetical protein